MTLDDFRFFLGRLTAPNHGIYQAFNNILRGYGDDFIVQGCIASGAVGTTSITEGWIMLAGELMKVDAQGPFDSATENTFTKVTTFDSRGNKDFQNGSNDDTYEQNRGVISGSAGTLRFDGDRFAELNIAETLDAASAVSTTRLKKKIIEIGDWNMDTLTTKQVVHGLVDETKIRTITVVIRDDDNDTFRPLNSTLDGTLVIQGAVREVDGDNIALTRLIGGGFDSALFNSTSFNRGWITIEYES